MAGLTDEELLASFYFNYRFQYVLGIGDFDKERIWINTLMNFRQRIVKHEVATVQDVLKEERHNLSAR
ncbi:transposase [Solibacillus silvestris]|uniref:transposase n=1 Tax=Solibacillus silvestris TaxID=76853 RepID=UPI003F80CB65